MNLEWTREWSKDVLSLYFAAVMLQYFRILADKGTNKIPELQKGTFDAVNNGSIAEEGISKQFNENIR